MKVLVVTVVHVPLDARIHQRQIAALVSAGHEVTYAAPYREYGIDPAAVGVRSIDVPRAQGRDRLAALRAARRVLRTEGPDHDVVLLHDPELLLAAARLELPPVVWDVHEDTAGALVDKPWLPGALRPLVRAAVRRLERAAEQRAHLILAEQAYVERFTRPHPVVPNTPRTPDEVDGPAEPRAVYLGRVSRLRGAHELVALARAVAPDVEVEVIGQADDDVRPLLEAAAADGVLRWRGFVPNAEALARLDGAAVGLSLLHDEPNYRASLPTKLLEYLAHGVPVVTTPLPAAVELVDRYDAGTVVGFGDVQAAVAAVRRYALDLDHARAVGERGRRAVREHHSWDVDGPRFVRLLEAIAADPGPAARDVGAVPATSDDDRG